MPPARVLTLAVVGLLVAACGAAPVTPSPPASIATPTGSSETAPSASAVATSSGNLAVDAIVARAQANAGGPVDPIDDRVQLLDSMGIRASLGADADQILALMLATEDTARSKQAAPAERSGTVDVALKRVPNIYREEFGNLMAGAVKSIGEPGDNPKTADLGTQTFTQTDGGRSATSTIKAVAVFSFRGSDATLDLTSETQNDVTDTASGQPVLTETSKTHMVGELDGCPSAAGLVPASLVVTLDTQANTSAGPGGVVASRATGTSTQSSKFQGTSDDTATLGPVTQSYTHHETFHRTTSADGDDETKDGEFTFTADGIDDGVPAERGVGAHVGGWSAVTTDATSSGDVTPDALDPMSSNAGYDFATMNTAYMEAQRVWRDTRCMIVTAPSYIPLSAFANNKRPTHTEEVDKGSTTAFDVGLDHRYGQAVPPVKIVPELNGKESLEPKVIPKPPGTLTYVAPDEDGQDALVTLTATSRQGIAKLSLTFHTGGKKLLVSIKGTLTTSGLGVSYTTSLSMPKLLLELQPDGTYRGSGPVTATMRINGDVPCPTPFHEKGTVVLTAKRPVAEVARQGQANPVLDESVPRDWKVAYDSASNVADSGSCLGISLGQMVQVGPDGLDRPVHDRPRWRAQPRRLPQGPDLQA